MLLELAIEPQRAARPSACRSRSEQPAPGGDEQHLASPSTAPAITTSMPNQPPSNAPDEKRDRHQHPGDAERDQRRRQRQDHRARAPARCSPATATKEPARKASRRYPRATLCSMPMDRSTPLRQPVLAHAKKPCGKPQCQRPDNPGLCYRSVAGARSSFPGTARTLAIQAKTCMCPASREPGLSKGRGNPEESRRGPAIRTDQPAIGMEVKGTRACRCTSMSFWRARI